MFLHIWNSVQLFDTQIESKLYKQNSCGTCNVVGIIRRQMFCDISSPSLLCLIDLNIPVSDAMFKINNNNKFYSGISRGVFRKRLLVHISVSLFDWLYSPFITI